MATLLEVDRRDLSRGQVKPIIVVRLNPHGGGVLDIGDSLVPSVTNDRRADALGSAKAVLMRALS